MLRLASLILLSDEVWRNIQQIMFCVQILAGNALKIQSLFFKDWQGPLYYADASQIPLIKSTIPKKNTRQTDVCRKWRDEVVVRFSSHFQNVERNLNTLKKKKYWRCM